MSGKKLFIREAKPTDLDLLFKWANNKSVRENSFNTKQITYEEFKQLLDDSSQIQFIMLLEDEPIGQARLSINKEEAEIHYSIASEKRGMGYGGELIRLIQEVVHNRYASIKKLVAKVKTSNIASINCLRKNGFYEKDIQYEYEMVTYKLTEIVRDEKPEEQLFIYLTNNNNTLSLFEWISKQCKVVIICDRLDVATLKRLKPKLVISYNYMYMISKECIEYMNGNIINMHISFLPWNRGSNPNIWSFIDDTPKGVTIHQVSVGLDEGDILFQRKIDFNLNKNTFETTYEKLNNEIQSLFQEHWDKIYSGTWKSYAQKQKGKGTYHTNSDLKELRKQIDFKWSDNIAEFLKRYNATRTE